MYILKQVQGTGLFYLSKDRQYTIGRKNADVVVTNDQSISREHALISVKGDSIILTDCGSKYGTCHNNKKMTSNTDVELKDNDVIKFGVFESKYEVQVFRIVTTASGLTVDQKNDLKNKLDSVGGSLVSHWNNSCTHLTAHEIILTVKVLNALIDGKPMVTPQYWDQFVKNVKDSKPVPNVDDFKPPITESLINKVQMSVNPARTTLFKGKVFVFATEKIKRKMADLITKAGGHSISWQKQPLSLLEVTKSKNKYIFIRDDAEEVPTSLNDIHQHLTKLGERTIPIQEIAMAVVFCSCEKDCNPKFNRVHNVFKMRSDSQSEIFSLVPNTPSEEGLLDVEITKNEIIIPESLECDFFATPKPVSGTVPKSSTPISGTSVTSRECDQPKAKEKPSNIDLEKQSSTKLSAVQKAPFTPPSNGPSTSKRVQESSGPPPKRTRLEDNVDTQSACSSSNTTATNRWMDQSISKKRLADESFASTSKLNTLDSFLNQETLSESKRTKSDETIGSKRKKTTKANPFALMKKKKEENPFVALRVKRDGDEDEENPFLQMPNPTKQTPSAVKEPQLHHKPLTYCGNHTYVLSDCSKINWLSTSVKNENEDSLIKTEIDPEFNEIFEKFKNTVIIERIPVDSFKILTPRSTHVSLDSSGERKNFKKFRKVQPRHPQTTILVTSFRESAGQNIALLSDGEEEQEHSVVEEPVQPVRKPPVSTHSASNFVF